MEETWLIWMIAAGIVGGVLYLIELLINGCTTLAKASLHLASLLTNRLKNPLCPHPSELVETRANPPWTEIWCGKCGRFVNSVGQNGDPVVDPMSERRN